MTAHPSHGYLVPRSAVLALWLPSLGTADESSAAVGEIVRQVTGDDEPHEVVVQDPESAGSWTSLLTSWRGRLAEATAVFPVPGDVMGLPPQIGGRALEAEECVLVSLREDFPSGPRTDEDALIHLALIPEITDFGSAWEPGHLVHWHAVRIPDWRPPVLGAVGSLPEAERTLRETLRQATEALVSLDVARWSGTATAVSAGLAGFSALAAALPDAVGPQRARLFTEAARLRFIIDGGTADDGAAINLWQSDQRMAALRHVDRAARHAMSAACWSVSANR